VGSNATLSAKAHPVFRGVVPPSSDQRANERPEQLLASLAGIVNELKEAEVAQQFEVVPKNWTGS
jgi:hypothetical protein